MLRDGLLTQLKQTPGPAPAAPRVPLDTMLALRRTPLLRGLGVALLLVLLCPPANPASAQDYPDRFLNGEIRIIHSDVLQQDRRLFVYLPEDYAETGASYPVHYVTDAPATSNVFFDLLRVHAIVQAMPRGIVVGLSSDDREHHLHPEKGAKTYLDFLEQEVIPFIEANYRTAPFRSIAGHSLGGGFAIYAFLNRRHLFNACIAGSPYPLDYLAHALGEGDALGDDRDYRFLYTSMGTVDDIDRRSFDGFKDAITRMAPDNLELHFQIHDGENHISNLAVNFQDGLEAFYSDWKFTLPDTLDEPVDVLLARHYEQLSRKVGYQVEPGEWEVLFPIMDALAKRGDFGNAVRTLKYCIALYPQSDQAYAFLARAYVSIGDEESARTSVEKALSINPRNEFALHVKGLLSE